MTTNNEVGFGVQVTASPLISASVALGVALVSSTIAVKGFQTAWNNRHVVVDASKAAAEAVSEKA
jgi:hypothetical protein